MDINRYRWITIYPVFNFANQYTSGIKLKEIFFIIW